MSKLHKNYRLDYFSNLETFTLGALPEGLVHELPSADEFQKPHVPEETTTTIDDLEDLRKQLESLNAI